MKLDLKNSRWWNAGFNNEYMQEQLNKFLMMKSQQDSGEKLQMEQLLEVRAAEESLVGEKSVLKDLQMASDQKDIRM